MLITTDSISAASRFAGVRHLGQTRKGNGNVPAIVHPIRVAASLEVFYPDQPELAVAAMLHDTIEDTITTRFELTVLFGERVADLVWAVTNSASGFRRTDDPDVLRLKAADMFDNISDTARQLRAGIDVWSHFMAGSGKVLRWRHYVDHIMEVIGDEPMAQRLDAKLRQVEAIAPPPPPSYATRREPVESSTSDSIDSWLQKARRQTGLGKRQNER